ncbi:hypothetical protein N7489_003017 [Penicillium chrysogenum]|uniref:Uncharacterized protein n=1 Tax=Penicillium chrysogenum TaxID=5076 RepID=A0ABQ8W7D2_PENCH|nr:uncharacterized protein N7489_003017 [Penicillium chrysogenum]KAJ5252607.1 hypothetical protein N7489_003017 [Penicillium chrysogenum]KAJ5259847.1 hypothetical protein N7505_009228 [Penicillium chrysogenum]KAJ6142288.1 hypothetical protein N7497_011387 [Penicillium chrysogenum]
MPSTWPETPIPDPMDKAKPILLTELTKRLLVSLLHLGLSDESLSLLASVKRAPSPPLPQERPQESRPIAGCPERDNYEMDSTGLGVRRSFAKRIPWSWRFYQNKSDRLTLPVEKFTGAADPHPKSTLAKGRNFTVVRVRDNHEDPITRLRGLSLSYLSKIDIRTVGVTR